METQNLTECLKVDFAALFAAIFPTSSPSALEAAAQLKELGILKRMDAMAELILKEHGMSAREKLAKHQSDTARGWAAFIVGRLPGLSLRKRLELVKPFADDTHFGVREWAWMAVRDHIADDVKNAALIPAEWTNDDSYRIRRFASEAIRPRGVWSSHIQALKDQTVVQGEGIYVSSFTKMARARIIDRAFELSRIRSREPIEDRERATDRATLGVLRSDQGAGPGSAQSACGRSRRYERFLSPVKRPARSSTP